MMMIIMIWMSLSSSRSSAADRSSLSPSLSPEAVDGDGAFEHAW